MIAWLVTNGLLVGGVIFAAWFLNGLRKAILKPRVTYVTHSELKRHGTLLTVKRQELLPPWRTLDETWLLEVLEAGRHLAATRESDGHRETWHAIYRSLFGESELVRRLHGLMVVRAAREAETEELMKETARAN